MGVGWASSLEFPVQLTLKFIFAGMTWMFLSCKIGAFGVEVRLNSMTREKPAQVVEFSAGGFFVWVSRTLREPEGGF